MPEDLENLGGFVAGRHVEWSECDAYAHHVSDDGKERVVFCSLARHGAAWDASEKHYDPDLDIFWTYADERL